MTDSDYRSVRVELSDVATADDPARPAPDPPPAGHVVVGVALAGLILLLWLVARPDSGTDAADDPIGDPLPAGADASGFGARGSAAGPTAPPGGSGAIVELAGEFFAVAPAAGTAGPEILASTDAIDWETRGQIGDVDLVPALSAREDGLRALTLTSAGDGSTRLGMLRSADGATWTAEPGFGDIDFRGEARSASLGGDHWAVLVDPDQATPTGSTGPYFVVGDLAGNWEEIAVEPYTFVSSYAATRDGLAVSLVDRWLGSLDGSGPGARSHLAVWSPEAGLRDVSASIAPFRTTPHVVDGERATVIVDSRLLVAVDATGSSWQTALTAPAGLPVLLPARTGAGTVAVSSRFDDPVHVALTVDGSEWRSLFLEGHAPEVLAVAEDGAVLSLHDGAERRLVRLDWDALADTAELRSLPDSYSELAAPLLAPSSEGRGFVGLLASDGHVHRLESPNGVDFGPPFETDLPSGFAPERFELHPGGYGVIGRTADGTPAPFASIDGLEWRRLLIETPPRQRLVDIDEVSITPSTVVVRGRRTAATGDADAGEVTFLQWQGPTGRPIEPTGPPCLDFSSPPVCVIGGSVAIDSGMIAIHSSLPDQTSALSSWSPDEGWRKRAVLTSPLDAELALVGPDVWVIAPKFVLTLVDRQAFSWRHVPPPGSAGRFRAVSPDGGTVLYTSDSEVFIHNRGEWTVHRRLGSHLGELAALGDAGAVFSARGQDGGAVLVRYPVGR